jgi:hypothetical protein
MQPTIDQLAGAILHLGYEDEETYPTAGVPFDVWVELQRRGHVERDPHGKPKLTAKGQQTFAAMESGKDVPEFTYGGEASSSCFGVVRPSATLRD